MLNRGAVLAEGSYAEVSQNPQVLEAYVGPATSHMSAISDEMLRVVDLHAFYGGSHILHGIDFKVSCGEVVTLLGCKRAGRSTTLRAFLNLTGKRTGSMLVNGRNAVPMPPHRIAQLRIGSCPEEERGIYGSLTAEENLLLPPAVASGGMSVDQAYAIFPNLRERRNSMGAPVRQRAADARICAHPAHRCTTAVSR